MLSRWRRLAREGVLMIKGVKLDVETAAELIFASITNRELDVLADASDRVWVGDITYLQVGGA